MEDITNEDQQALELGMMLGQRKAFGMIAGRCSAANAECLRKIRDERLYLRFAPSFDEYCDRYLKMNRRTADRVIALQKEFGSLYFETAELTGVTPRQFRRIARSIEADGIHVGGEVIALIPANADRALEAVALLQAEADSQVAAEPQSDFQKQLDALEKRGRHLADAFRKLGKDTDEIERQWLNSAVRKVANAIAIIEAQAI